MSINLRIGMRMTRTNLRIMMVATVNEEGSSCSKLAANFSQLDFASILHCTCTACAAIPQLTMHPYIEVYNTQCKLDFALHPYCTALHCMSYN